MPRDSSGNYSLPAGNPVVTGTTIASAWANSTMSDIGTEITDSLDRSGKGSMLAVLKIFDGVVTAPGLAFGTEPATGIYRPASNQLALSIAGVQKLLVTTTALTTNVGYVALGGTFQGVGVSSAQLLAGNDFAGLYLVDAQQAADNRFWAVDIAGLNFAILTVNDADSVGHSVFGAARSGVTVTSVGIGNSTDKPAITLSGPVTIPAPAAGVALTITGVANAPVIQATGSGSGSATISIIGPTGTANSFATGGSYGVGNGVNTATLISNNGGQTELWQFDGVSTWHQILFVTTGRAVAIAAPSAGFPTLTLTGVSGTHSFVLCDSAANFYNGGYLEVPPNSQTVNYTCVKSDSGKCIDCNGPNITATIPANASVAYTIGTCISFTNSNATNLSIAITTDTMTKAGSTTTGTRTLSQNGMATARKITATSWLISGTGLS